MITVYGLVAWIQWVLVLWALFLLTLAFRAWRNDPTGSDRPAGAEAPGRPPAAGVPLPTVRRLARWAAGPFLLAGGLQWLLGLDSAAGWWNLLGWAASGLVLVGALTMRPAARNHRMGLLLLTGMTTLAWLVAAGLTPSPKAGRADLRRFDADAVAHLETAMWRSYYDKERLPLFLQLRELMSVQYGFSRLSSFHAAYLATRAAFVFKVGKERPDYAKALPYLEAYYQEIRQVGNLTFDPKDLAALELEWWIVHRQEDRYSVADLATACARLMAALYRVDLARVTEHGRLRAEAMKIQDQKALHGGLTSQDWNQIEAILRRAYRSLYQAIREPTS